MSAVPDRTGPDRWQLLRFLLNLPRWLRLYARLLRDRRVSLWVKAMLVGAVAYVVVPFDLLPDTIPLLGEVDDVVVLAAAAHWFLQWCPPDVVAEHVHALSVPRAA
ncbi:MAG: DUF1232 domain-containing protein [Candidatus Binatia bacterium]